MPFPLRYPFTNTSADAVEVMTPADTVAATSIAMIFFISIPPVWLCCIIAASVRKRLAGRNYCLLVKKIAG